jgi:hypothetical protein
MFEVDQPSLRLDSRRRFAGRKTGWNQVGQEEANQLSILGHQFLADHDL